MASRITATVSVSQRPTAASFRLVETRYDLVHAVEHRAHRTSEDSPVRRGGREDDPTPVRGVPGPVDVVETGLALVVAALVPGGCFALPDAPRGPARFAYRLRLVGAEPRAGP